MEEGDYDEAVKDFTQAVREGAAGDSAELLRIASDLQERHPTKARTKAAPPPKIEEAHKESKPRPVASKVTAKNAATKQNSKVTKVAAVESDRSPGLLLVTSTPSGLVVEIVLKGA